MLDRVIDFLKDQREVHNAIELTIADITEQLSILMQAADLAQEAGIGRSYFCRVVKLGILAPTVVDAFLKRHYPASLTAKQLSLNTRLPIAWEE